MEHLDALETFNILIASALQETHLCQSPFQLVSHVPPKSKKTVLDAVDSYHDIAFDEHSQPLTTLIMEEGCFMYLRPPQGHLAAGDTYTRCCDEIIKDIPRKTKIVDDTLIHDTNIENAFYLMWDHLLLCSQIGIAIKEKKFKFCWVTIEFAVLKLTQNHTAPSDIISLAIKDFPKPTDLMSA